MNERARVLIVEDELIIAKNIERYLTHLNYEVVGLCASAEQVAEALSIENPDIVLMDIRLEGKEDGVSIAQKIHEKEQIPVVYLTALMDETTLERAKITEPFGYIVKPFTQRELHIGLEIALYKSRLEKKMREQEIFLQSIIDTMKQGFCLLDADGKILYANTELAALIGVSKSSAAFGQNIGEFLWPTGILQTHLQEKEPKAFEAQVVTKENKSTKVIITPQKIQHKDQNGTYAFISLTRLEGR